jgi:hypothetical protein
MLLLFAGKYYLVDAGYPNEYGYLGPYKGERYHFQEFRHRGQPSGWKEVFNCLYVLLVCCCSLFKSGFVFYVYYQLIVLLLDYLLNGNNVML